MKKFVAINYITCEEHYMEKFEHLFSTRAHAIDTMPGFIDMYVLKPQKNEEPYLVISHWETEEAFKQWTQSTAFIEGHKRAFADLEQYKLEGKQAPMKSSFKTYQVISE